MHYFVTLVTASPSIEAGDDDPVGTGEVRPPVQLEMIVHLLTAGASVPAQVRSSTRLRALTELSLFYFIIYSDGLLRTKVHLHMNQKRIFFRLLEIGW